MNVCPGRSAWTASLGIPLVWEDFGEEVLVYCERSGETHYLNLTAAEILSLLEETPKSAEDLVMELRAAGAGDEAGDLLPQVEAILQQFVHAGLICTASP
jgi:PqqD family protein of HPr-rel-A system